MPYPAPNPFPKFFYLEFMYQPYTAPTLTPTRPATGLHTFPRQTTLHKPIHQRHRPHIPHTTDTTLHKYTHPYSLHKHIQPPQTPTDAHTSQPRPPSLSMQLDIDVDRRPDALAATHQSAIGQARQTGSGHTKPDRTGSGRPFTIEQARHQTDRVQDQTRSD